MTILFFSISEVLLAENSTQIPRNQLFSRRKPNSKPKSPPKFIKALENRIKIWYTVLCTKDLPVAQLDSASDSDSEGQRFKSVRVGQKVKEGGSPPFFTFLSYPNVNENRSPQSLAIVRMGSESVRVGQQKRGVCPLFFVDSLRNGTEKCYATFACKRVHGFESVLPFVAAPSRSPQSLAIVRMGSESSASTRTCFPKFAPQNFAFDILQCAYDNLLPLLNFPSTPPAILPSSSSPRAL